MRFMSILYHRLPYQQHNTESACIIWEEDVSGFWREKSLLEDAWREVMMWISCEMILYI